MSDPYSDDECRYLGGDPRLDERGSAMIELQPDAIRIEVHTESATETLRLPKASIERVLYEEQRLGFEQAEFEEGVLIDPNESLLRQTVVVVTNDPEAVIPGGICVRLGFRNEYYAKVFEKRCAAAYGLPDPTATQESDVPF